MKLEKKFALRVAEFVIIFLDNQFWPLDETEEELVSKTLAYAKYHGMVNDDYVEEFTASWRMNGIKKLPESARLDLTDLEMESILDMMAELSRDDNVDFEMEPNHVGLTHYIRKQVFAK